MGAARGANGGGVMTPAEKRVAEGIARLKRGERLTAEERQRLKDALDTFVIGR